MGASKAADKGLLSVQRPDNLGAAPARQRLEQGNRHYCEDRMARPRGDRQRRQDVAQAQRPFATVLTCADSRVPPELIFDQGLGDLFVVRVAGNVADPMVMGSIEYASLHLGVNLVVVMGHQSCGAVGAAVDNADFDGPATHSHIDALIDAIKPAVHRAERRGATDLLERSIRENAIMVADQIRGSEPVVAHLGSHGVQVTPAYYDLKSGQVDWL